VGVRPKPLRIADANGRFRRQFARWMFEDYPRAALVTPHRWRRALFTRPGAFGHDRCRPPGTALRASANSDF
jgi:hypothetical protein